MEEFLSFVNWEKKEIRLHNLSTSLFGLKTLRKLGLVKLSAISIHSTTPLTHLLIANIPLKII